MLPPLHTWQSSIAAFPMHSLLQSRTGLAAPGKRHTPQVAFIALPLQTLLQSLNEARPVLPCSEGNKLVRWLNALKDKKEQRFLNLKDTF